MGTCERSISLVVSACLWCSPSCTAVLGVRRVLPYRPQVRLMLVSNHFVGEDPTPFDRLLEKRLCTLQVAFLAQQHVHNLARFIHRAVQVSPLHTDPHVGLVYKPAPAERFGMPSPRFCQEYAKLLHPVRYRLPRHVKTTLSQQVRLRTFAADKQ